MAPRAVGTVTISFGLVSIPAKLYSATSATAGVSFNLLHKKCGSRMKQQYICTRDGEVVERDDMVKGYEYAKDQYVRFTPEELKELEEKATGTVDVVEFVPLAAVDPVYFDKPYYVAPDKGGDRAFRLFCEAMKATGRSALARYPARGKQYLVLLRPSGEGLVMQQLLYADEVKALKDVPVPNTAVRDQELKLAIQLIDQISTDAFRPEGYHDEVKERIEAAIRRKVDGQEVHAAPVEAGQAQVIDIMEALKASLAKRAPAAEAGAAPTERAPVAPTGVEAAAEVARKPARRAPRRAAAEGSVAAADDDVEGSPARTAAAPPGDRKPAKRAAPRAGEGGEGEGGEGGGGMVEGRGR